MEEFFIFLDTPLGIGSGITIGTALIIFVVTYFIVNQYKKDIKDKENREKKERAKEKAAKTRAENKAKKVVKNTIVINQNL